MIDNKNQNNFEPEADSATLAVKDKIPILSTN
jgi:hypothetical protein